MLTKEIKERILEQISNEVPLTMINLIFDLNKIDEFRTGIEDSFKPIFEMYNIEITNEVIKELFFEVFYYKECDEEELNQIKNNILNGNNSYVKNTFAFRLLTPEEQTKENFMKILQVTEMSDKEYELIKRNISNENFNVLCNPMLIKEEYIDILGNNNIERILNYPSQYRL